MHLNDTGKIAAKKWIEIPDHFTNVLLGEFVIMPDHIQGIIHIISVMNNDSNIVETGHAQYPELNKNPNIEETRRALYPELNNVLPIVETGHALSLQPQPQSQTPQQPDQLSLKPSPHFRFRN